YIRTGSLDLTDVNLGDSIATNGVCLTVTELTGDGYWADVSNETLAHTRFPDLMVGSPVNLEKAMRVDTRFGGHIVTGHVDGVGCIVGCENDGRSIRITVEPPKAIAKYIAHKGSITVDGVSLTVNELQGDYFVLNIVPHTAAETTIESLVAGAKVHLEVDIVARYLERLLGYNDESKQASSGINMSFLAEHGFMRR
ncbi:MAG: riboflavin synthase, partial [Pontibacterium sp.]